MPSQDVTLSYTCWVFSILMYLHFLHWPNLFFICWCKTCVGEKPHQDFSRSTTNEPPWFINKVTIIKIIYPSVFSLSIYISAVPYIFYIHIYISSDIDIFCRYFHGRTQVPRHRIPGRIWPFMLCLKVSLVHRTSNITSRIKINELHISAATSCFGWFILLIKSKHNWAWYIMSIDSNQTSEESMMFTTRVFAGSL